MVFSQLLTTPKPRNQVLPPGIRAWYDGGEEEGYRLVKLDVGSSRDIVGGLSFEYERVSVGCKGGKSLFRE